jgi:hypothetical protein
VRNRADRGPRVAAESLLEEATDSVGVILAKPVQSSSVRTVNLK